ncbi:TPA: hypothetical protein DDW35_09895 [Candidatus Sumerlaeota bacterium]|nr:hypothetical protein [Candidatus Sumerlaeota bacterium]
MQRSAKPTITCVAKKAGCSITTVSFVLNGKGDEMGIGEEMQKRVREAAEQLNYPTVTRGIRTRKSYLIGVMFLHLMNNYANDVLRGIRTSVCPRRYCPLVTVNDYSESVAHNEVQMLLQKQVDAILCEPVLNSKTYQLIQAHHVPSVFMGIPPKHFTDCNFVSWNTRAAACTATQHLIKSGRKRIAFLNWSDPSDAFAVRQAGYQDALEAHGLGTHPHHYAVTAPFESPEKALRAMFSGAPSKRPDAVMTAISPLGIQALGILENMGLHVPDDVAIMSMGRGPSQGLPRIGLSTVVGPRATLGEEAARIALQLINSPEHPPIQRWIESNELLLLKTT